MAQSKTEKLSKSVKFDAANKFPEGFDALEFDDIWENTGKIGYFIPATYSNRKFNINGRVCLENSIWFGLLGALLIYIINPFLSSVIAMISDKVLIILGSALLVIFITDLIISLNS